jgi:hypothetical protein
LVTVDDDAEADRTSCATKWYRHVDGRRGGPSKEVYPNARQEREEFGYLEVAFRNLDKLTLPYARDIG